MMKKLILIILLSIALFGCYYKCKDEFNREITNKEIDFFPDYKVNDTIYYKDIVHDSVYYLIYKRYDIIYRKPFYNGNSHCSDVAVYYDVVDISLKTDIPFIDYISIEYFSREADNLFLVINETVDASIYLTYDFRTNQILEKGSPVEFFEQIEINGDIYFDVYKISRNDGFYYSSIFYNNKFGFIRFTSTKNNKDIILLK